jgi:hypothetical protein
MQRVSLERLDRVFAVRGHEDHRWHTVRAHRLEDLEGVQARHLDVEEHQIRRQLADRRHRFGA